MSKSVSPFCAMCVDNRYGRGSLHMVVKAVSRPKEFYFGSQPHSFFDISTIERTMSSWWSWIEECRADECCGRCPRARTRCMVGAAAGWWDASLSMAGGYVDILRMLGWTRVW